MFLRSKLLVQQKDIIDIFVCFNCLEKNNWKRLEHTQHVRFRIQKKKK